MAKKLPFEVMCCWADSVIESSNIDNILQQVQYPCRIYIPFKEQTFFASLSDGFSLRMLLCSLGCFEMFLKIYDKKK